VEDSIQLVRGTLQKMSVDHRALIFIAQKIFSEAGFLVVRNALQRARIPFFISSDSTQCIGEYGLKVMTDVQLHNVHPNNFSALIIIGGDGIVSYQKNDTMMNIIRQFVQLKKTTSAICMAPTLLAHAGVLRGVEAVSHPDGKQDLISWSAMYADRPVIQSGNIITARDALAATEFIHTVINQLNG
jgi:protease I